MHNYLHNGLLLLNVIIGRGSAGVKVSLTIEPMLVFLASAIRHLLSAYIFPLNDICSQVLAISHR